MFITISNSDSELPLTYLKSRVKLDSKLSILFYTFKTNELALNDYFMSKYKVSLREMCLKILTNGKLQRNIEQNKVIFLCGSKKDDEIASLITYGNGKLQGSRILIDALTF